MIEAHERDMNKSAVIMLRNPFQPSQREVLIAALRIVKMAAPYSPFPPDIRKDYDVIEITRTWTFTNSDQVRAN